MPLNTALLASVPCSHQESTLVGLRALSCASGRFFFFVFWHFSSYSCSCSCLCQSFFPLPPLFLLGRRAPFLSPGLRQGKSRFLDFASGCTKGVYKRGVQKGCPRGVSKGGGVKKGVCQKWKGVSKGCPRSQREVTKRGHKERSQREVTKRGHKERSQREVTKRGHKERSQREVTKRGHKERSQREVTKKKVTRKKVTRRGHKEKVTRKGHKKKVTRKRSKNVVVGGGRWGRWWSVVVGGGRWWVGGGRWWLVVVGGGWWWSVVVGGGWWWWLCGGCVVVVVVVEVRTFGLYGTCLSMPNSSILHLICVAERLGASSRRARHPFLRPNGGGQPWPCTFCVTNSTGTSAIVYCNWEVVHGSNEQFGPWNLPTAQRRGSATDLDMHKQRACQ